VFALGTLAGGVDGAGLAADDSEPVARKAGVTATAAIPYVSFGMKLWGIGGIIGYIAFWLTSPNVIGRRPTILIYSVGTLVVGLYCSSA